MPSKLLPTEPTYSSGTTDQGEYLSTGERKMLFKKGKITGAAFKRGSSADSSVGEARGGKLTSKDFGTKTGKLTKILRDTRIKVNLNEKKIAALEVADTKELEPAQDQAQPTESLIGPLKTIDNSVNGIVETLKKSNKADAKAQSDARKAAEKKARAEKESIGLKEYDESNPMGAIQELIIGLEPLLPSAVKPFLRSPQLLSQAEKVIKENHSSWMCKFLQ